MQRSFGKYQQTCEDLLSANIIKYQITCVDLWANISICAIIFYLLQANTEYMHTCKDLHWANISRRAKICRGQISEDVRRSLGKYQRTCKDLLANISIRAKICCGQISEDVRRSLCKYQRTCKDLLANISRRVKIC